MKFGLTALSAVLLAGIATEAAGPPPVERAVNTAIGNFKPLWSPPAGQLRGWVIGIDPAEVGGSQPRQHLCDDLSLVTAAYLYHFVLAAGGSPVLTRTDATRAADPARRSWEQRVNVVGQAGCDLCVSIRYDEAGANVVVRPVAAGGRSDDALLADALSAALDVEPADTGKEGSGGGLLEALRQSGGPKGIALCEVGFGCPLEDPALGPDLRKAGMHNARRLYAGISRFCTEKAARPGRSSEPSPLPVCPTSGTSERLKRLGRSIWPQGRLPNERLDWFCQSFAQASITNRSLVFFEVSARLEQDTVILHGRTNVPRVVRGLEQALQGVGVEHIRNQVQTLPNRQRLGEHLFGVCRTPMALTYDQPENGGGVQTQLLFGEPLFLLDRNDEHYLLHAGDGYWGWVRREAVQPMTAAQFEAYMRHARGAAAQDIEGPGVMIPRGSSIRVTRADEKERVILLPDGTTLTAPAIAVTMHDAEEGQAASRVRSALDLLYVPYLFGGCSPVGLDCSGMVRNVWARAGRQPPRDAWQQAFAGRLVATRWHRADIQRGDQLFFIDESGKIYHTGFALDALHVVHATRPCVQISSLDPQDPLYDAELDHNFFLVKRP